jgi:hypothetical protein
MQLRFEVEGRDVPVALPGEGAELVAFLSFAVSRGFGAQHPLIALADRLHDVHGVHFGPLTTFYEADIDDREDEEKLEMAWQEPAGLLEAMEQVLAAARTDPQAQTLLVRAGAEALPLQIEALLPALRDAARSGARVRLSYTL